MLGRVFSRTDAAPTSPETVILTSGYWRTKFGADSSAVGRTLMVDGVTREIVGVLPDTFRFLDRNVSLVVPYRFNRSKVFLGQFSYSAIARLKPGISIDQASADLARMIPTSLTRFPPFPGGNAKMFEEARTHAERPLTQGRSRRRRANGLVGADGRRSGWSFSSHARTWRTCSSCEPSRGSTNWRFVPRLAPARDGLPVSCCSRASRSASLGGIVGLGLAFGALRLLIALAPGNLPRLARHHARRPPCCSSRLRLSVAAGLLFGAIPMLKYAGPSPVSCFAAAGGVRPRAGTAIARAIRSSSPRSRWRSCSSSARG